MIFLYNLALSIYHGSLHLAALFHPKARQWVQGRKNWEASLTKAFVKTDKIIWVHCASLGEFEQGRPLIKNIKTQYPSFKILLTFYSPSGYELRKNEPLADHVAYLPTDSKANAKKFLEIVQPQFAIFVKYEFWYHYLSHLQKKEIPVFLVSAVFRKDQIFFKPYGGLFRQILHGFNHIFVQNSSSANWLKKLDIQHFSVSGDNRVDQVHQLFSQAKSFPIIASFSKNAKVFIAGSTWPNDEAILIPVIEQMAKDNWKFIIAPHEIKASKIQNFQNQLSLPSICYSEVKTKKITDASVMIIDNIGMLSTLYQYGHIAYIGGGFGVGIHNILEPIVFGLPVIFGKNYHKFTEAVHLVEKQGAFTIKNSADLASIIKRLSNVEFYKQASQEAQNYITQNKGATKQVMKYIGQKIEAS